MSAIVKFEAVTDLATKYGLAPDAFLQTMREVSMPKSSTDVELMSCLLVAREHGLNPLTKEIYFMRDKHGTIQPIVGVDGWIRKCNEHPQFDGMDFKTEMGADNVAVSMTCRIYRKDRNHPTEITEYMSECRQKRSKPGPWDTHPNRMIRNRTLCQTGRVAFGFAGIMDPDEFDQWQRTEASGEPIALKVVPNDPREGGDIDFRGEGVKRPSSNAAKGTETEVRFNKIREEIANVKTFADLHDCYDAFCKGGNPWAEFPTGWARMMQIDYHYRLIDLTPKDEPEIALVDEVTHAIENAATQEKLGEIFREHFDGEPWGTLPEDQREDVEAVYDAREGDLASEAA